jgi:hypothetical protein
VLALLLAASWPALQGCTATPLPPPRTHVAPELAGPAPHLRRILVLPVDLLITTRPERLRWGERLPAWLERGTYDWVEATLAEDLRRAGYQPVIADATMRAALAGPMTSLADRLGERLALTPAGGPLDVPLSPEADLAAQALARAAGVEAILLTRGWLHVDPDATTRKAVIGIGITLAVAAVVALVVVVAVGSKGRGLGSGLGRGLGRGLGKGLSAAARAGTVSRGTVRGAFHVGRGLGRVVRGAGRFDSRWQLGPGGERHDEEGGAVSRPPGPAPVRFAVPSLAPWVFPLSCLECIVVVPEPPPEVTRSQAGVGLTLVDVGRGRVVWHASDTRPVATPRRHPPRLWSHLVATLPRPVAPAAPLAFTSRARAATLRP